MAVPTYGGVENFMGALMGGGVNETAAYDARMQRLINQRSSTALMDKRIQDAITSKQEADAMIALNDVIDDPLVRALTQSGTGSSYSAAQTGDKQRMQNEILQLMAPMFEQMMAGGQINPDILNAITAGGTGKLLSPTNVNVMPQAQADENAQTSMAGYRDALTALTGARTATENENTNTQFAKTQTEEARGVAQQNLGHRYVADRDYVEERADLTRAQTKYTNERSRGGSSSSSSGKAPFSNAAFVNAMLGTPDPDTGMYDVDQEFYKWQAIQAQNYPQLAPGKNDRLAYGAFISKDDPNFNMDAYLRSFDTGAPAPAVQDEALSAVMGSEEPAAMPTPEAETTGPQVTSQEDALFLIQYAEEMIRKDPDQAEAINAKLQEALAKGGFEYVINQGTGSGTP